jgi:type III restriction enzyme
MEDGVKRLVVLETKGDQLAGNLDTEYKRRLMQLMASCYEQEGLPTIGTLELEFAPDTVVECRLVRQEHWRTEVDTMLRPDLAASNTE